MRISKIISEVRRMKDADILKLIGALENEKDRRIENEQKQKGI